ncbi:MAG: hypothetical protein ABIJ09_08195 [Pseudomonadota bacterium]
MTEITILIALLTAAAVPVDENAAPGSGAHWLQVASAAYEELRFDDARVALDRALRDPSSPHPQLVQIYRLQGVVEASMGQPVAAKRAFAQMLVLDPQASPPDEVSPKISTAFEAARASLPGERGILIECAASAELRMGQAAELPIRISDTLGMVEQLVVRYQVADAEPRERVLGRADQGMLHITAQELPVRATPYVVRLQAEAQNLYGVRLAELDSTSPGAQIRVVQELSADEEPLTRQWWFWTSLAGGAALAAVVAGGLTWALAPRDSSPRDIEVRVE